ncbi:hypothetical protein BX616_006933 [Lobosporangium transversale]|nr:hypothetical protein BX616_006933 [Lobosporangium transversale]
MNNGEEVQTVSADRLSEIAALAGVFAGATEDVGLGSEPGNVGAGAQVAVVEKDLLVAADMIAALAVADEAVMMNECCLVQNLTVLGPDPYQGLGFESYHILALLLKLFPFNGGDVEEALPSSSDLDIGV